MRVESGVQERQNSVQERNKAILAGATLHSYQQAHDCQFGTGLRTLTVKGLDQADATGAAQ